MTDKQIVTVDVDHDPYLVVTWPDHATALRVTLSFEGDFLPMFPVPADIVDKVDEKVAREQFSRNMFEYIGAALKGGEAEEETENDE